MNPLKVVLIDDELSAIANLRHALSKYEVDIVSHAFNVDEGIRQIKTHQPDLIFLDIAMPVKSGFDLLKEIDKIDFEIIFVTAFDKYALKAIEFCALGYILKPIDADKLASAMEYVRTRIISKSDSVPYHALKENILSQDASENKLSIKTSKGIEFVLIKDIVRIEADGKYSRVFLKDSPFIHSSKSISHFEKMLEDHYFFKTHKSHIIHLKYFKSYDNENGITLINGGTIPLSRRKKTEFLDEIKA